MSSPPKPGEKAPAFSLPRDGGGSVSLNDFSGRKLVLYFYPKDDTTGCIREAMDFEALRGEFGRAGTDILGVSPDSAASHDRFKKKHNLSLALAADENRESLGAYGVWVEKSMYGRSYMGVERTTVLIDEAGKVSRIWSKVKVPGHAEEVLAAVRDG